MKKVFFLIAAITASSTLLNAQTSKGTIMAGGSASINFQNSDGGFDGNSITETNSSGFNLNPSVGYFFRDKFVAGIGLGIGRSKVESDMFESSSNRFTLEPFARYYLDNGIFFLGNVGFGRTKFNSGNLTTRSTRSWRAGAGYAFFFNEWISVEPTITYGVTTNRLENFEPASKRGDRSLVMNVGFNIFLR